MTRQIHIFCPECSERSTINKVEYIGVASAVLTCTCNNNQCGHVALWECGFDHTIKKPLNIEGATERNADGNSKQAGKFTLSCNNCGQRANIGKTERVHKQSYTLYCRCTHAECQHRFTSSLNFKAALVPGAIASSRMIQDIIKYMPADERKNAINALIDADKAR